MKLRRVDPNWQTDFLKWLDDGDWEFITFDRIAAILERHLQDNVLRNPEFSKAVAKAIPAVLGNCDQMDFNEPGEAEAYSIIHFLDRYHRFQINFREILNSGRWPRLDRRCVCIDIGTGPAPALYALSDMVCLISKFRMTRGYQPLSRNHLSLDYVEQSNGFRNWLHGFTEFADITFLQSGGSRSGVPYHNGTFKNLDKMEFNEPRYKLDISGHYVKRMPNDIKHRFNMVIASNFFTSAESVAKFCGKIQQAAIYTKNRGLLVFVGAVNTNHKYRDVYDGLDELITNQDYCKGRYVGSCAKIVFPSSIHSYCWSDRFGQRLKRVLAMVIEMFEQQGVLDAIEPKTLNRLREAVNPKYAFEAKWELHAYNRESKLKNFNRMEANVSIPHKVDGA